MISYYSKAATRLIVLSLLLINQMALAGLTATVNKNTFSLGETIALTLHGDKDTAFKNMDFSPLNSSFEILHRSNERRVSIVNGQSQETVKLNLLMRPKEYGRLMIPSLKADNEATPAIQIQVNKGAAQTNSEQAVTIESQWLKQGPAYVQSQMTLKIKIRHDGRLQKGQLDSPTIKDAMVNTLGADTTYQESIDGKTWQVIERHFAVTPLKSGDLAVPPLRFQGQISRRLNNNNRSLNSYFEPFFGQSVDLQTSSLKRTILPPAAQFTGTTWLPAKSLQLSLKPLDSNQFSVGDPVNLKIDIDAVGLLAEQLPGIQMEKLPSTVGIYPDNPVLSNQSDNNNIRGKLSLDLVLIPAEAGEIQLPELSVVWWNIDTQKQEVATLALPKLTVASVSGTSTQINGGNLEPVIEPNLHLKAEANNQVSPDEQSPDISSTASSSTPSYWKWLAIGALLGWIATAYLAFFTRKNTQRAKPSSVVTGNNTTHQNVVNQVKQFALANNPKGTYETLQKLSKQFWPKCQLVEMHHQLQKMGEHEASKSIKQLSQHLYSERTIGWDGTQSWASLEGALAKIIQQHTRAQPQTAQLKPLYPA